MSPKSFAPAARTIFLEAVESHPPDEWPSFLESACGDNAELRRQVARLLAAHGHVDYFMARPAAVSPAAAPAYELIGQQIGRYKLLEQIAEGGMGVVYVAEQIEPFRRKVALKLIKPGMDSRQVIARFEAERQALALMDHPHIAKVLDAGTTEAGRPYFVMELVCGLTITDYCDQARLAPRQRLALMATVCQAVQHAHQKGIIHRDLKPGNLLVTLHDGSPVVKVIDFGVAKALHQQLSQQTIHTQSTQMIGTPLYMSPEQAELSRLDVDTRSDVYSLGVVLYELLTGHTPFDPQSLQQAGFDELRRMIREDEPPRPSARVSTLGQPLISTVTDCRGLDGAGSAAQRRLVRHLRGELDWIVMKALEKDRTRRYQSASDLAADIRRYLDNQPIHARPASLAARALKWRRRNPVAFLAGLATVVLLIAALVAGLWHNQQLASELAVSERLRAENLRRASELQEERYASDMRLAWSLLQHNSSSLQNVLDRYEPQPDVPDVRGFEWHYLRRQLRPTVVLSGHQTLVWGLDVSPDGKYGAGGDRSGEIRIWELPDGKLVSTLKYCDAELNAISFSPNGKWLATAGQDKTVRLWTVGDWQPLATLTHHDGTIYGLAWSPDSRQLASISRGDCTLCIWDAANWSLARAMVHDDELRSVAWSPQGNLLAAAEGGIGVRLWDTASWQEKARLSGGSSKENIEAVAFSPDGSLVAAACHGGGLRLFDVADGAAWTDQRENQSRGVAFLDDRHLIDGEAGILRVWEIDRQARSLRLVNSRAIGNTNFRLAIGAERALVATAGGTGDQVNVLESAALIGYHASDRCWPRVELHERGLIVETLPNGALVVRGREIARLAGQHQEWVLPAASPDQRLLAIVEEPTAVRIRDTETWQVVETLAASADAGQRIVDLQFSPDGQWLAASLASGGQCGAWRLATGEWRRLSSRTTPSGGMVAFSRQGLLATSVWGAMDVEVWDLAGGQQVAHLETAAQICHHVFLPSGELAVAHFDGSITLWDVTTQTKTGSLLGHLGSVAALALSRDGRTLASTGDDYTIRLWSVPTRRALVTLFQAQERVQFLEFQPGGDLTFTNLDRNTRWTFPAAGW